MNKTLEILFDKFRTKKLEEETEIRFNRLCEAIEKGSTFTEQLNIEEYLSDYSSAIEAEAFTAGFNYAVQLFISN